ncbi:MAG: hypothetical protein JXX14_04855 [Deltaproteobacteria bacterium]|nr:hypothetical protein [Deltaproteobacteria bacterium]
MSDPREQERMVKDLEVAIERLQSLYNQYFMGIERLEPLIPKKAVERQFNELRRLKFANTALRFRFQSQVQKYSTHLTHWRRICRQIEEGTYKRDIMRAKARVQKDEHFTSEDENIARMADQLDQATGNGDGALPVFDLQAMLNEVEDAFEQGFDLDEQLNALTSMVPTPVRRTVLKDEVKPAGSSESEATFIDHARRSGVPIPVSSLKAARKTDEARQSAGDDSASSRLKTPVMPPPPKPPVGAPGPNFPPRAPNPMPPRAVVPPPPPPPKAPAAAQSASGGRGGVDDQKIQSVYRAYIAARKKTNEPTDNINLQKISDLLRKTEKAKGGVSDFKVVIRDGKAVIKAVK